MVQQDWMVDDGWIKINTVGHHSKYGPRKHLFETSQPQATSPEKKLSGTDTIPHKLRCSNMRKQTNFLSGPPNHPKPLGDPTERTNVATIQA